MFITVIALALHVLLWFAVIALGAIPDHK